MSEEVNQMSQYTDDNRDQGENTDESIANPEGQPSLSSSGHSGDGSTGSGAGSNNTGYNTYYPYDQVNWEYNNTQRLSDTGDSGNSYNEYGGNIQYKWNYDDYQKALGSSNKPPKKNKKGIRIFLISLSSVVALAIICLAGIGIALLAKNGGIFSLISAPGGASKLSASSQQSASATVSGATSAATGLEMSAEEVYATVKDSIVTVEVYDMQSVDPSAEGSGIIVSDNNGTGYIVTNEHVVRGASSVQVVLFDGTTYDATVIGYDTKTDLAVIRISASGLTVSSLGNSDDLSVAESVLTIGSPGGIEYAGSVTQGIISALNRKVTTNGYTETCIQIDAAINPGNSGGALVNMSGQVVGITSSKIEETGYEGMGFAIPINTAIPVINDIIQYGYVTGRVKIGITVSEINSSRASALGYPAGLLVNSVESSSDAAAKGIQANDIITAINGISITTYNEFYAEESKYKAGDSVMLTVYRLSTKKTFTASITLQEDRGTTSSSSASNNNYYYYYNNSRTNSYGY